MGRRSDRRTSCAHVCTEVLHLDWSRPGARNVSISQSSWMRRARRVCPTLEPVLQPAAAPVRQDATGAVAAGDVDGDGADDVFISMLSPAAAQSVAQLYRVQGWIRPRRYRRASGISLPQGAVYATFADYDNDGWLDLFAIGGDGRGHLFRNNGNGTFADVTAKAAIADVAEAHAKRSSSTSITTAISIFFSSGRPAHRLPQQSRRDIHRGDRGFGLAARPTRAMPCSAISTATGASTSSSPRARQ